MAAAVWQQSHVRSSTADSVAVAPLASTVVETSIISFTRDAAAIPILRPSNHTAPTPPRSAHVATNPCSAWLLSRWGVTGALHVAPSSRDCAMRTPYAYEPVLVRCNQCATR